MVRLATDVGGTFTDLIAYDETSGRISIAKTLTTIPDQSIGVMDTVEAARGADGLDPTAITFFVHGGTTVINSGTALPPPEEVLQGWVQDFGLHQLAPDKLMPFVERTLEYLEVAPSEEKYVGDVGRLIAKGCDALGYAVTKGAVVCVFATKRSFGRQFANSVEDMTIGQMMNYPVMGCAARNMKGLR